MSIEVKREIFEDRCYSVNGGEGGGGGEYSDFSTNDKFLLKSN